jgi:acyl-CoA synthetase (NDP forming)/GNAT superfamily N-acetyltransferase
VTVEGRTGDSTDATTSGLLTAFTRDVLLATGRAVRVRPARADDIPALGRFYAGLSRESSYFRFFGARSVSAEELERATRQDVSDHVTLIVDVNREVIAVGEYYAVAGGEDAEVAFAVADAHHHEGIATVLLEDLAAIAREAGFRRLVAETLQDNAAMLGVFREVGLVHRRWFEDGVVHVSLDLTADDLLQDHADLRDWRGAVRSLQPILRPQHVVVIGAGRDRDSSGRRLLANLRAGFGGRVSVVHPSAEEVGGVEARRSVGDLDEIPDLALIVVPAAAVADVVEQCGEAGVRCAVVISAGFAETGGAGAVLQEELLAAARRYGMRLVGPNSLGVVASACGLDATITGQRFAAGGIAIASQSGGVSIAVAAEVERRGAGVSSFVSMGNKADVSGNDLLRLWADDDRTSVILLYLESFGDPVRFGRIARAVSRRKPVVALKGGQAAPVATAGSRSSSAVLLGKTGAVGALFSHTGVIRARTMEELIDIGLLLDRQPPPRGARVAVVGNAGGPVTLGGDAAEEAGAVVPPVSTQLEGSLRSLVPDASSCTNPIDLGAAVDAERLADAVRMIAMSGEFDACVVVAVELGELNVSEAVTALDELADVDVTISLCIIGGRAPASGVMPIFPTPERAAAALGLAAGRASWLAATANESARATVDSAPLLAARAIARRSAGPHGTTTWLRRTKSLEIVEAAGVPVAGTGTVAGESIGAALQLLVGGVRDPALGPYLVIGAGGEEVELRADRAVLVAPIGAFEARSAIERLQLAPLFHGYQGRPRLPVDDVVELVVRVGLLMAAIPEIDQLDLNPVIVTPAGCAAVDALIGLSTPRSPIIPTRGLRGG